MAQVLVHGTSYEIPESFTLKEMRIVDRYCEGHAASNDFTIGKICAMIHIAIARTKPDTPFDEIQEVVDGLPADQIEAMFETVAGQSPPAEAQSNGSTSESSESSTGDSEPPSAVVPESETLESSGSLDSVGFRSFHSKSEI